ncbi:MAG TPA: protein translocase SEC61 complex subunit gamma [Candidatus Bathyarchaeia archaeon]|nr:protein translocase SEC61 complex subunit gamma [Candidatus Bathyarchaeia archaeon]
MELKFEDWVKQLKEYIRILKLAKRPKRADFFRVSKIAGAAMALIGTIGFTIYLLLTVLPKGF